MDIQTLTTLLRARWEQLKAARDAGQSSTELAVITGALLIVAGLVVVAIKTKALEKIGIINGG
ncbi:hypothetical protein ACH4PU_30385 [Streptomyces sp. NPDC021100]|uniref:hypothetical protein n=1 Tax=Streptomyces sp. NPDC021100 TaxID=3365114 RepID=UPI00379DD75F